MPRKKSLQTDFSAGELAPEVAMRQDTDQYQHGAKSLLNRRMLIGGGHVRRPGSWLEAFLATDPVTAEFIVNQTTQYVLSFTSGAMHAYLRNTSTGHLTAAGSVTGGPWTGTIYKEMDWVQRGNVIFLTHASMPTQRIARTDVASWSRADFSFSVGSAGRPEQPYLKLAPAEVTLQPSGLTGAITVLASASVFGPAHVGQYIRYFGKAIRITAYHASTQVGAVVVEPLPRTQTLTVGNASGFTVGDVVEGSVSGAKGVLVDAFGSSLIVTISHGLTPFQAGENVTGPNVKTNISGVADTTPAAAVDWDEQLFGPAHGYPSCVELHRNRLLFGGHPAAPDYLIGSTSIDLYNFNVGTGADTDGIMESIGDAGASKILQLSSAEQLLVLTDRGPYYVAEGQNNPFRASSLSFLPFGSPWPINATAQVQPFDSGAIMVSKSLIIKTRHTGNLTASWDADVVSLLAPHLIHTPDRIAVASNFAGNPESYAAIRNSDGSIAMLQLVEVQKIRNFTPWTTQGQYLSVASIAGDLYAAVRRTIGGVTVYTLELFDQNITVDCATRYSNKDAMNAGVPGAYGNTTVNVVTTSGYHLGEWPLSLRTVPAGPYAVGLYYTSVIETLPPVIEGPEGPMAGDFMRILECYVDVLASARFSAEGTTLSAYQITDDVTQPPPLKTGPQRFQFMGWEQQPTITITQADPLPLQIRSIRSIVAYGK